MAYIIDASHRNAVRDNKSQKNGEKEEEAAGKINSDPDNKEEIYKCVLSQVTEQANHTYMLRVLHTSYQYYSFDVWKMSQPSECTILMKYD